MRFTDEELKHQELFRRIEQHDRRGHARGLPLRARSPNDVAAAVLGKSTWAVLALTCHIELFTQAHYRESIEPDADLSPLFKDVFLFHWQEESQHAILDELEWRREDATLDAGRARPRGRRPHRARRRRSTASADAVGRRRRLLPLRRGRPVRRRAGGAPPGRACSAPIAGSTSSRARGIRGSSRL